MLKDGELRGENELSLHFSLSWFYKLLNSDKLLPYRRAIFLVWFFYYPEKENLLKKWITDRRQKDILPVFIHTHKFVTILSIMTPNIYKLTRSLSLAEFEIITVFPFPLLIILTGPFSSVMFIKSVRHSNCNFYNHFSHFFKEHTSYSEINFFYTY